jgi:titin
MSPILSLLLSLVLSDSPKSSPRRRPCREARRRFALSRPRLEVLEDRALPSAYVVTTTADGGPGSLRDAINQINADTSHTLYPSPSNPSVDEIDFKITATSDTGGGFNATTGVATIKPQSTLPSVTNAVTIDGWSQPGFAGSPLIELDGAGISMYSSNCTVRGFAINRVADFAIRVGGDNAWIYGNYIGTDPTGTIAEGNVGGIDVQGCSHVLIGTNGDGVNDLLERNLISGSLGYSPHGIYIQGASDVTIQGNYLGTDVTGNAAIANQGSDIRAQYNNSQLRIIGNLISGNGNDIGISFVNTTSLSNVVIQGNRIGTNAAGTAALGNLYGIYMNGSFHDVTIGGTAAGAGNLISGNGYGISSYDGYNVTIQGNTIGTDVTGKYAIPNAILGVLIAHATATNITIGGTAPGSGNLISGNGQYGVSIAETAGPVLVEGNTIGTDVTGSYAIGNGNGVVVSAASGVTIGGTTSAARNLISGNTGPGVALANGPTTNNNLVEGNYIGTNASGLAAVPNNVGVTLSASNNSVVGNLISGNGSTGGVYLQFASNNTLQNNLIGTDVTGNKALPNQGPGVYMTNTDSGNAIGTPGQGNVISGNAGGGIFTQTPDVSKNTVQGNFIGTNAGGNGIVGTDGKSLGNAGFGIYIISGHNNTIGGSGAGTGNVIAGNQGYGVGIDLSGTAGNVVQGNFIGTDISGTLHLGNAAEGVGVGVNSSNVLIGGTAAGQGNTIAFNAQDGVFVPQGSAISILGDSIHDNGGLGIHLASGANNNQAAPVLTAALSGLGLTIVTGTVASTASATVRVEFFANAPADPEGRTLLGSCSVPTDAAGNGSFTAVLSAAVPAGQNLVTATVTDPSGDTSQFSAGVVAIPIPPASLSGVVWEDFNNDGQVDFGESGIDGVTVTLAGTDFLGRAVNVPSQQTSGGGAYSFLNLLPGNYTITETQPAGYGQGINPIGTAGGSVSADQFSVALGIGVNGLNYNFGEQPPAGGGVHHGQTAGIGFWNNKNGQALIKALNGGGADGHGSHQLGDWLARTLPNTFGVHAGSNNLAGKDNAYVAALFQQDFVMKGVKLDAQLLATALAVYATNATLDSTQVAASYGFTVSGDGAGTATANVGSNGDAFGVANNTTMTLMDLLLAADAQAVNGVLYNGNATRRNEANNIFSLVNQDGGI